MPTIRGSAMYNLPEHFTRLMIEMHEDAGVAWLERLPALIDDCAQRWSLTMLPPYTLSYNYVAPATRADGTPVVLKVGFPSDEMPEQIPVVQHYAGQGMVQVLEADPDWCAFAGARAAARIAIAHGGGGARPRDRGPREVRALARPRRCRAAGKPLP